MMDKTAVSSMTRQGVALSLYRGLLNTFLLVALLHAFPGYEAVSILSVLVFSQGVAGIGLAIRSVAVHQLLLDDMAERKTRHTIVVAADPQWLHDDEFWIEVDRRVEDELDLPDPSPWWAQTGMTIANFGSLLLSDIISIMVAYVIATATG